MRLPRRNRAVVLVLWLIAACCTVSAARADESLYRAKTIVTGQLEPNRRLGFAICLEDVLIKVSGAFQLAGDPRLAPSKARAGEFVTAFDYRDQKGGRPKNDEQGTRDRSFDLIVDYDSAKIDDLLATLGLKPWTARPMLGVAAEMVQGGRRVVVASSGGASDLQRQSLLAAADKRGLQVVLPPANTADQQPASGQLAPALTAAGAQAQLIGQLSWNDDALAWDTQWQLDARGAAHRWTLRGTTFDDAFRRALGGAAQILSGNGDPQSD